MFGTTLTSSRYFLYGPHLSEIQERVLFELERLGVIVRANPDVYMQSYTHLSLDDVRVIRNFVLMKEFSAEAKKICIIDFHTIGVEAQNALLKILEEGECHFFIIAPSFDSVLETLRSRMVLLPMEHSATERFWVTKGKELISMKYVDRLKFLDEFQKIHDRKKNPEEHAKIRTHGEDVLNGLEQSLSEQKEKLYKKWKQEYIELCEDCNTMRSFLRIPSSTPKSILEYIVTKIPV